MGHTAGFAADPSMAPGSCSHFVLFHIFGVFLCFFMFFYYMFLYVFICFYVFMFLYFYVFMFSCFMFYVFSLVDQIHPLCIPATKYTLRCQSTGMPSVA